MLTRLYPARRQKQEKNLFDRSSPTVNDTKEPLLPFLEKDVPLVAFWHRYDGFLRVFRADAPSL